VNQLLAAVEKVKGVHEVVNALEGHMAGSVPSLQGGSVPHARRADAMRREWSPTTRLALGTAGVAGAGYVEGVEMCLEAWSLPSASALLLEPQEPGDALVDRIGAHRCAIKPLLTPCAPLVHKRDRLLRNSVGA
jgi:hypothetical protein